MRVLYVEAAYGFGGSLTGLLHLFRHLPPDVEPVLVTTFDPWQHVERPADLLHRQVEVPAPPADAPRHWSHGLFRYYQSNIVPWGKALHALVDEFQPDVIHANNGITLNLAAGRVGRQRGLASISHQKNFEYPGRLTSLLLGRTPFDLHIATSGSVAKHLVANGLPPHKCTTIYEPVIGPTEGQLAAHRDRVAHLSIDEPVVVGMHSMLVYWKGQDVFLRAVAEVLRRGRVRLRPVIAGTAPAGEAPHVEKLRALEVELGLVGTVEWVGHVRDPYDFLSGLDVAVHAATHPEPFGRVAAEAMLAGVASIVTTDGGPGEYVIDGVTGLRAARGDHTAMADAIERLALSAELRRDLGAAGRDFAVEEFDADRLAGSVVRAYHRVLDRRPVLAS
ncbi:MAG: glycosyltransferase family 4 protein [Lacipirellulaceae bacterium]